MTMEAIKGAGMTYQGSSSTAETKVEAHPKTGGSDNAENAKGIAKENIVINTKAMSNQNSSDDNLTLQQQKEQMNQNHQIRKAVEEINKSATGSQSEAIFGIHDKTNRVTIKIVDKKSREVLKEYPPEKTLDMIAKVWEMAGIMVDEKR